MTVRIYRQTTCDRCHQRQADCLFVRRDDEGHRDEEACICGACRAAVARNGVPLVNIDADFGDVTL